MDHLEKLGDWVVPSMLGAAIYWLRNIATELKELGKTLAVAVARVDQHESRIENLEEKVDEFRHTS